MRLWRALPASTFGRPASLTTDQIVSAAVALADREGLRAATLPKVAASLGVSPMSLYRHIGSKDELVELMTDLASGLPPRIAADPQQWRAGIQHWADELNALLQRRPWLTQVPVHGPPAGPNSIGWLDAALRALSGLALHVIEKLDVITLVTGYVHQSARVSTDHAAGMGDDPALAYRTYAASMSALIDPDALPDAAALFAADPFAARRDAPFTFGLNVILDGVAATEARAGGA
jgi:AcrR family transcriptional regulator